VYRNHVLGVGCHAYEHQHGQDEEFSVFHLLRLGCFAFMNCWCFEPMFFRLTGIKDISDKNYTLELLIEADDAATVKKFLGDQKVIII